MQKPIPAPHHQRNNASFLWLRDWCRRTSKDPNYRGIEADLGGPGDDIMLAVVGTPSPERPKDAEAS